VVASAISTQALSYTMKVGARAPLHAVSAGKIVLADLAPDALKDFFAGAALTPATPRTIRSKARLRREIAKARAAGYAYSHEEFTPGITAIAIAVRPAGKFAGAVNIAVPTVRFTGDREAQFREALRLAARAIEAVLG